MKSGTRIGLAMGFGYLIGRRKKLRTALVLAAAVAAGRASQGSGGLLKQGQNLLQSSPQLGNLGRLGSPLVSAGKAAATAAAGNGIDALSGRLRGGADALRRRSSAASGGDGGGGDESGQNQGRDQNQGQGQGGGDQNQGQNQDQGQKQKQGQGQGRDQGQNQGRDQNQGQGGGDQNQGQNRNQGQGNGSEPATEGAGSRRGR
ncbi:hypothetical protein [Micromonospora okii]|uniref:hypothetical protein n=1 Tax=Micromonospora okii TaxID=1182970 RepID=UPI001E5C9C5F|nr:hypothetical protein [Micromonospora okii]